MNAQQKTLPWHDHEYIIVDGYSLVYTVDPTSRKLTVRYPGGAAAQEDTLRLEGRQVVMPSRVRRVEFV